MRLAMYMPRLYPGSMSWTLYQDLADAVRERGHHFEVFTDARPEGAPEDHTATRFLPWRPAPLGLDRWSSPFTRSSHMWGTARSLAAGLRGRDDLELLYVEIAYPYGTAADIARSLAGWRGALVLKPTGEDVLVLPEARYGFRRHLVPRLLLRRTLRRSAGLRCISPLVVEAIAPFTDRPCAIIPSAVANATIAAARRDALESADFRAKSRTELRERLGTNRPHLVLALGRMHPFKGLHFLVQAMAEVPDAHLVLAGPSLRVGAYGDYRTYLRRLAAELGVEERVSFLDRVAHESVLATLAGADVVVVPSLLESMNKVCVEAAAVGTPFVVTHTTGVSTYLEEDGVGEVVPPADQAALAAAIRKTLSGHWPRNADATLRFVERFAPATVAGPLCDLFAAALAR